MSASPEHFTEILMYAVLVMVLLACALTDARRHRIPNVMTLPMICLAITMQAGSSGWEGLLFSLKGCGAGFLLFFVPYMLGGMGAGDVKLMAAVGAVIGIVGILQAFLYIVAIGGLFALVALAHRRGLRLFFRQHLRSIRDFFVAGYYVSPTDLTIANKRARFGYGTPIALGTFAYLLQTHFGTLVP